MTARTVAALSILALMPLSACVAAAVGTAGTVGVAAAQDRTLGEAVDDATASNEIKAKLMRESAKRFGAVDVEVANGLVLLSGRVTSPEDRVRAEGIAWTSNRIEDVANEVRVEGSNGFIANLGDEVITGRVRSRLIGSSTVKSLNFNIETYDGVVYLMGTARSEEELQRAAEEAAVVPGVEQVISYVRILTPTARPLPSQAASYQAPPTGTYGESAESELLGGTY